MTKTVCITRLGAIGDMFQVSPVFRLFKEKGYEVTANVKASGKTLLKRDPNIDKFLVHDEAIKHSDLDAHWESLASEYDEFINLNGVVENKLLPAWYDDHYKWDKEKRHEKCNKNYMDATLAEAGLPDRGLNPEYYQSPLEKRFAKEFRRKYAKGKFLILWGLSGSSHHKAWAYTEHAVTAFLEACPDTVVVTVGDDSCTLLEWDHERLVKKSGLWPIRKSVAIAMEADVVVGTETGIMNAASAFDTPKVLMLSHSSEENLSKYWKNCTSLCPDNNCHPCHKLHYGKSTCELDKELGVPKCCVSIGPATVLNAIDDYYQVWRNNHGRCAA